MYNTGTAEDLELYNVLIACNACNGVYSETDVRINGSPVIRDNGRRNVAFAKGSGFIMGIMTEAAYIVINDVDAIGGYIGMKRGGSVDTSFLSFPEGYQAQLDFSAADFLYIVVCKTVFSVDGAVTTVQVPYGTSIKALSEVLVYPQIPQLKDKPSDMTSHYFARWVDGEGNVVGLEDPVRRPLSLFASYRVEEHTLSVRDTAPTCTEAGHRITSCAKCGYVISDIETAEPGAHSVRVLEAVEPDCTHTGLTEGSDCSVCGQILIPQRTIAALGHTPKVSETAIEPDCTHDGRSESSVCAVCGVTLSVSAPVGATGHTPVKGEALAPTCTEQGHTAGAVCSVCGETVTEQEPIPATGHEWGVFETVKDPTESEPGLRRYKCKHCDATEDVEVPKIVRTQEGTQENTSLLWLIAVLAVVLEGECAFFAARIHAIAKRKKRKSEIIGSVVPPVLLAAVIPSQIPALIGLGAAVGVMAIAIGLTFVKKR